MSSSSDTPTDTIMVEEGADIAEHVSGGGGNANVPKPKRLACMICRKRKLKCDGNKPSCSTCARLGHSCAYDEVRRKSGPKRGYVKALEERLKQVETLLHTTQDGAPASTTKPTKASAANGAARQPQRVLPAVLRVPAPGTLLPDLSPVMASNNELDWDFNAGTGHSPQNVGMDDFNFNGTSIHMSMNNVGANFTWEMIGLGLEEPLPPQETIDELHQIYFEKIHPTAPMIHKYRYLAAMNLAPNQRPPVCLRYAMWTMACSVSEKYGDLKDLFYQRTRKYIELDNIKGYGEHMISVAHAQTHSLLAQYEFKMMYFPRAWMSTGAAVRLSQMMGLHRLDGAALDVKQCLPEPRDWTEKEERRRTFWMAFCQDRYSSIGTGWPMVVDEKDIGSCLPASEEAFETNRPEQTPTLEEAMTPTGAGKMSSYGAVVLMACLFGRNLNHLHRPDADGDDSSLNGEFWRRHRTLDNILLNTSLCLPNNLKLPEGMSDPNVIWSSMCRHTSTICLHQAAIFKAEKARMPASVSTESKVRCITGAKEIASIMRMISHLDLASMNPFISFCLYVSARVFVQYLKSKPDDSAIVDSLRFLLSAMNALKRKNPLTESFLVQLDVDLEVLGSRVPKLKHAFPRNTDFAHPPTYSAEFQAANSSDPSSADSTNPGCGQKIASAAAKKKPYKNDCFFSRTTGDDGNPADAPNIADPDASPGGLSSASSPSDQRPTQWNSGQPGATSLPVRQYDGRGAIPFSASLHGMQLPGAANGGYATGSENTSGLTPGSHSSGPDIRQNLGIPHHNSSGQTSSYGATSPQPQQQSEQQMTAAFFEMTTQYTGMAGQDVSGRTGMTPQFTMDDATVGGGNDFPAASWGDGGGGGAGGGGTGMTPGPEMTDLRNIMGLGPMDPMDLTVWDAEINIPG